MEGRAWWAAIHGVAKSRTRLNGFTFTFHFHALEKKWQPFQWSCLENPRDGGAWWAAVYGVAQSQTWLKWLSSSSSMITALMKEGSKSFVFWHTWYAKLHILEFLDPLLKSTCYLVYKQDFKIQEAIPFSKNPIHFYFQIEWNHLFIAHLSWYHWSLQTCMCASLGVQLYYKHLENCVVLLMFLDPKV